MTNPFGPGTDLLAQLRVITDVLLPVLREFRHELGAERADAIAARGLAEWRSRLAGMANDRVVGAARDCWEKNMAESLETVNGTVDVSDLVEEHDALRFAVTGCRVAEFFRSIGEPALGFELGCAHDLTQVESLGRGEVRLDRRGTLMTGASACDFAYRFAAPATAK